MAFDNFLGHGQTDTEIAIFSLVETFENMLHIFWANRLSVIAQANFKAIFHLLGRQGDSLSGKTQGIVENIRNSALQQSFICLNLIF